MPKLILINPVQRKSGYLLSRATRFQPLGLAYIAAVTPPDWEIKIIDENFDNFTYEPADLVGITAFSTSINRAYEIAKIYKKKNTPVVIGGIHASLVPEEVFDYADVVVVGEVEGIWHQVIKDFETNTLSKKYIGPKVDLANFNIKPRRDLLNPLYLWQSVQTSRGCPHNCNFCSVTQYLGTDYRQRTAEDVLNELRDISGKYIAFVDDNLIGYSKDSKKRAVEIFKGMKSLKKKWWMQCSINAAEDEQLIKLAAKAGCQFVFIGFETIESSTLKNMHKGVNLKAGVSNYSKAVKAFHRHGIAILGAFILGNDYESTEYYSKLADFCIKSGIDIFQISILTPLPGTALMNKLQKEGRLCYQNFPQDWEKYRFSYLLHRGNGIGSQTVYEGNNFIKNKLYSYPHYHLRLLKSLISLKSITKFYLIYKYNKALKKSWQNSHYFEYEDSLDWIKLRYLINMSNQYLDSSLEKENKGNILEDSQKIFYQTLYEDSIDPELNKQAQLFAVMAQNFCQEKPLCPEKAEALQKMITYLQQRIK
jgi:radical SAM superfamily enzyme YgiQ (UPF0313 family)